MSVRERARSLFARIVAWRPPFDRVDVVCLLGLALLWQGVREAFSLAWAEIVVGALLVSVSLIGARK